MIADTWFQSLPGNWRAERLKIATRLVDRKVIPSASEQSYIGLENVESWTGRLTMTAPVIAESTVNEFSPGDILFGKLRPYLAKALRVEQYGVCSTEFLVLRPRTVFAQFLLYTLLSRDFIDIVNAWTYGVKMPRANWDVIGNLMIPVPPLDLQSEIVSFLDRETAEADALVAKYERLIELLEEKRVALITQAVTKGLDPGVPMKDSGIESIGEIPEHWEIRPIARAINDICDGPFGSSLKSSHYSESGTQVIRLQNIGNGYFDNENRVFVDTAYFESLNRHDAQPGDLIVAGLGDTNNFLGRACLVPKEVASAMVKADCFRLRLDTAILLHDFAMHYLNSEPARAEVALASKGATRHRMNLGSVARVRLPYPPVAEQRMIVAAIDDALSQLDLVCRKVKHAVGLVLERRSSLITAAVTGQIDVNTYRSKPQSIEVPS